MQLATKCYLLEKLLCIPAMGGLIMRPFFIGCLFTCYGKWYWWAALATVIVALLCDIRGAKFGMKAWECGISPKLRLWKSDTDILQIRLKAATYWAMLYSGLPYTICGIIGWALLDNAAAA